jgi:hypothetical protein
MEITMTTNRMLLVLALSCWLAAPVAAQSAPAPAPAPELAPVPAVDPMMPVEQTPADPAAPPADPLAAPAPAPEAMPTPEAAPAPEPTPALAPTPAPAPPAAAAVPPPEMLPVETGEEHEETPKCALKDLCLGPMFSLGLVNVVGFGAAARYGDHVGFAIDYQFMPSLGFGDVNASWSLFTLEGRWHVGGSAFWLGGGFGLQSFSAQTAIGTGANRMKVEGSVSIPALKLGLGVMGRDGFVMGIDLGFNIPLGGTDVGFNGADPDVYPAAMEAQASIEDTAEKGVKLIPVIPQLNLLRIGYLF